MQEKLEKKFYIMKQAFGQKELHEREAACTRNEPPQCAAGCPLHVDARALCAAVADGDYAKGLSLLRAATPFVSLLAARCDAPCTKTCVLESGGKGGIDIHALEAACLRLGAGAKAPTRFLPRKTVTVAVLGDDLFALAAAAELGLKGYEVTWYTASGDPRDALLPYALPDDRVAADLAVLGTLKLTLKVATPTKDLIAEPFGAFCLSPSLAKSWYGDTPPANVFAQQTGESVTEILCAAKSAALSADRFVQGVQTEQGRLREGAYHSDLFVAHSDIASAAARTGAVDATDESQIRREAARCIQCACTECIKGCAFLQHYKTDPRRTIREIYNNMSIVMGDHHANAMINSCAQCAQCSATCPNHFDVRGVCKIARETMVETGKMPPSTHEFALLDLAFSNGEAFLSKKPANCDRPRYVFFPGCQASAVSPDTVAAAYRDLAARLDGGVALMLGCCGAVADWSGRQELFGETLEQLTAAWTALGQPVMIAGCPTCRRIFSEFTDIPQTGVWDILNEIGLPQTVPPGGAVLLHDACGARNDKATQDAVRTLLRTLGCAVTEPAYRGETAACCGYGGLSLYANRVVADKLADACLPEPDARYVSYCMACRDRFSRRGAHSRHLLELVYGADDAPPPTLSARRYNRLDLKQKLLKDCWSESMEQEQYDFTLEIDDTAAAEMEDRMILRQDMLAVFAHLRADGNAVLDKESGLLLTSCRIGNVTFWARYEETGGGYLLRGAYSYRMTVEVL